MRTTIDIDDPILHDLKQLQQREGQSLGRLVSDLLAQALAMKRSEEQTTPPTFQWVTRPMAARVDLTDKDDVFAALEERVP